MVSIGGSVEMVALVQSSVALPLMLFLLPAGAMADILGRRRLILAAQSLLLVVSVLLAIFAGLGWLTPWGLLGFTFAIGTARAFNTPAWQTYINDFVTREEMPRAILLNSINFNFARGAGPAIGGIIVAGFGAFAAFLINALSNLILLWVIKRRSDSAVRVGRENLLHAMQEGLGYVAASPQLLNVTFRGTLFNFSGTGLMALMPLVARDLITGGAQTYGALLGAFGVGGVLAVLVAAHLRQRLSLEVLARIGFTLFGLATTIVGLSHELSQTLTACALAGGAWVLTLSAFNTDVQLSSAPSVVSRVHAIYQTAGFAGVAAGAWFWGIIARHLGLREALCGAALSLVLGALTGLFRPLKN